MVNSEAAAEALTSCPMRLPVGRHRRSHVSCNGLEKMIACYKEAECG